MELLEDCSLYTYVFFLNKVTFPVPSGTSATARLTARRGNGRVSNAVASDRNTPMVNTAILRINAAGTTVASLSNRFALGMHPNMGLGVSCVNFGSVLMAMNSAGRCGVRLGRSARTVRRVMIMNCNARGGMGLANTVTAVSSSGLIGHADTGMAGVLTNRVPNIAIVRGDNRPNTSNNLLHIHNLKAVNGTDTVIIVSNIRSAVDDISPGSVRGVSVLGSTTTSTVCNIHTTGNIVLVAAGGNSHNHTVISCSKCMN